MHVLRTLSVLAVIASSSFAGCVSLPRLIGATEGPAEPDRLEPPIDGIAAPAAQPGSHRYGINASYSSYMRIWDISNASQYATLSEVPSQVKKDDVSASVWGVETANTTLIAKTREIVGSEQNTLLIAKKLFVWLYDYADYDTAKAQSADGNGGGSQNPAACPPVAGQLQRAGCTYDLRKGICGDLSTLYITMLRIAGVPARPVHGYLDNPGDPARGVPRIGDFHVWVEVWVGASLHGGASTLDWMTVDPSGITGPYDASEFLVLFGIFNPEHLVLGRDAHYDDPAWNTWASFGWTAPAGSQPSFTNDGAPREVRVTKMDLYFDTATGHRTLVPSGGPAPRGFRQYFPDVTVRSVKTIDYGADMSGPAPENATIVLRHPAPDGDGRVLPWQSVTYTVYTSSTTVERSGTEPYSRLDPRGFVVWEDRFS